ncbi:endonuclease/exonuclease/phosphatase family protein [Lentiprolixibacter aurantiacus]|uniref:Endonuclease/exonuclease/phosphatase family protein n=1 Tax=Lentiprolixibacter aurantiacus TaxID=2993939 RepID=A0AAE3SM34_9FLAO|nr:endonuclease/exonuclease/phosphatase family protein [Lentiprolixibacter aurantiacus]MCX2718317.1 endonuclease/exonuclease/phosphatase family protein [Lentiprolixibacter aurantiacus]
MKNKTGLICWGFAIVFTAASVAQQESKPRYRVRTIAFYNLENLFDISNDSLTFDDDRTPGGKYRWTAKRYRRKIGNLATAISLIGQGTRGSGPDIIGLCELENEQVIRDLFSHEKLKTEGYQWIHYDSPDERGIDVALAYRKSSFTPFSHKSQRLLLEDKEGYRDYTRDLLVVGGMFEDDELFILVNHWPSRSGGESRSQPFREAAARLNKRVMDSIRRFSPNGRIVIMGDFNDNPMNSSIMHLLKSKGRHSNLKEEELFNPMEQLYKKGLGSLGYRDQWHLFDQIILTSNMAQPQSGNYFFWKAGIFNPPFMVTSEGPFRRYPKRTYVSGIYQDGYSDHFPVYIYLLKKVE